MYLKTSYIVPNTSGDRDLNVLSLNAVFIALQHGYQLQLDPLIKTNRKAQNYHSSVMRAVS